MSHFLYKNTSIFYIKEGNGFPVVLLHGFAEDSDVWKNQTKFLKQYCTLIIPDLPGSGRSEMLQKANGEEVIIADYADCIYALLQHEQIEKCTVLGHSMGGYIALALAEKYPDVIKGFGFVQSTAFADSEEKKTMRAKAIGTIERHGSYAFIRSTTPNLFSDAFKTTHEDEIESLISKGNKFTKAALQQYYKAMMLRNDKTSVLQNSGVPVLFIMGKEDKAAALADLLKQAHLPSVSYIHMLPGAGHMGLWEAAEEVNVAILDFIKNTEPA